MKRQLTKNFDFWVECLFNLVHCCSCKPVFTISVSNTIDSIYRSNICNCRIAAKAAVALLRLKPRAAMKEVTDDRKVEN